MATDCGVDVCKSSKRLSFAVQSGVLFVTTLCISRFILSANAQGCGYSAQPGGSCGSTQTFGVSQSEQEEILKLHNDFRSRVANGKESKGAPGPQPSAADMKQLKWDAELATSAQGWANKCQFGHDPGNCRQTSRFSAGQNVYMAFGGPGAASKPQWSNAINTFYNEVSQFPSSSVRSYQFSGATGHYSQIVWGATEFIGCGYVKYGQGSQFSGATGHYSQIVWGSTEYIGCGYVKYGQGSQYYVCNYGPAGNMIGGQVYQQGQPCSKCKGGCSTTYPGLCN